MRKDMWAWKGVALVGVVALFSQADSPVRTSLSFMVIAGVVYVWEYYIGK